ERLHGVRAQRALLRRALRRAVPDPDHLLHRADQRRRRALRHRLAPAGGARPAPQRSPRPLRRRGSARPPPRRPRPRARRRRPGRAVASPLRPRGRGVPLPGLAAGRAEGRVCVRALSRVVLRELLLPEELRPAGLSLAPARRRRGGGPRRDRGPERWPHAGTPVTAGRVAGIGTGDPRRRLLLLAGIHRQGDAPGRGVGSHARHALDQAAEDARAGDGWAHLPQPRPRVLEIGHQGPGLLPVSTRRSTRMKVLEGIKVLELARVPPAELPGMMFADMGAGALKTDTPPEPPEPPDVRRRAAFAYVNRNKRSIALNLKAPDGQDIFTKLAAAAGVLVEGFRPGVTKRLGADYETIKA